ncbi:MFS transporter [Streptomyces sp. NPDC018833]|uniref:MFS transporter n=1 Tax=Streptomyces sp. NPDC018833 TaxID=3365053 RepID=UPI0037B57F08
MSEENPTVVVDGLGEGRDDTVRPRRVLTAACLGYGMVVLDTTVVNVAIPTMQTSLHADLAMMQVVVDSYVIVLASLVLAGATAVARFGAVPMYRVGVGVFGVASLLCGVAPNGPALVALRILQGIGAILLMPATLVMLTRAYPNPEARAKAMAVWATVAASPVAFGPTVGGSLVASIGWRSIFLINVPVVIGALWMASRFMPPADQVRTEPQDFVGQALAAVFLGGATLALVKGHEIGWGGPVWAAIAVVCVALAAFVVRQRTYTHPMLPADLLRSRGFSGFVGVGLLLFAGYYGLVFVISLYLQQVRGYGPVATGISFLPAALPITFTPLLASRISAQLGALRMLLIALSLTVLGAVLLMAFGSSGPVGMSVGLFAVGLGFGLATVPQITLVMATAPSHRTAIASGMLTAGRQSGASLGVALLGGLQSGDTILIPACAALVVYLLMLLVGAAAGRRARIGTPRLRS